MYKKILFAVLPVIMLACNQTSKQSSSEGAVNSAANDTGTVQTLKEAYEFGFPLIIMKITQEVGTNTDKPLPQKMMAPVNQLANANQFPDDKFRVVVRPNNDTYYSSAYIDLEKEPLVLSLPNTNGRYYLFPMLDAWTNVFFSPGKRTTGTDVQVYLITGPKWNGEVPKGMQQVKAPTDLVWLLGRTQVNSAQDGATVVKKIQEGYKLVPLSAYGKPYTPPPGKLDSTLLKKAPNDIALEMSPSDYFNLLNKLMVNNPPATADADFMKKLAPLSIAPGATFDPSKLSSAIQDSLKTIPAWAKTDMDRQGLANVKLINGWGVNHGLGNYGTSYAFRAGVAFAGLGANLDADAGYPGSKVDADGEAYDGSKHSYVMHFDEGQTPPANAFWSLTMYNNEGFLCANPINRFAIGDRNPLKKNADGSVDLYIQRDDPGKDKENNWLPAPNGPFNLLLRVYWPKEEMLNGSWIPPAVVKVK